MKKLISIASLILIIAFPAAKAYSAQVVIQKITGTVETLGKGHTDWASSKVSDILTNGDAVRTGRNSRAELISLQGHKVVLMENSSIEISKIDNLNTEIKLGFGKIRINTRKLSMKERFEVRTPNATCSVRGTQFGVNYSKDVNNTLVSVYEGVVNLENLKGEIVSITKGKYSGVSGNRSPSKPKELPKKSKMNRGKGKGRMAKQKREIFEEISKQDVIKQASKDIKNAEYQNGKALIDAYGKRVRLEEYIMRPQPDQFKYVVLNQREDRFDFGKILFTFNRDLPEDLTLATQSMFRSEGDAPPWHPTDILSVMSNTQDKVTEIASGGHPESASSTGSIFYYTVFDKYDFLANDTRLWGYDNTSVPSTSFYYGDTAPTSVWQQMGGSTKFHFIAKDTYNDGTWIQAEDFIINDNGEVADFSDIVDPSNATADDIRSRVLQMNFERVYTSSLFDDRSIDLVYSAKLLSDAGILNLPSSLGAPSAAASPHELYLTDAKPRSAVYRVAKVRKSNDPQELAEPLMPFDEERTPALEKTKQGRTINQILNAEIIGGQYFVEGRNTSLKGNASILYVPVINFDEDKAILPIYVGNYRGTKDVNELVGGGTLTQKSMEHSLYVKGINKTSGDLTYKGILGATGEWLSETKDESFSEGLFNNYRYTAGVEFEIPYQAYMLKTGYDFNKIDYFNYKALSSNDRFAEAGVTDSMGTDVLNFNSHNIFYGFTRPLDNNMAVGCEYRISYLTFGDQKIIQRSGNYADTNRRDIGNTISVLGTINTKKARLGLGYGMEYYVSNQNAYDANRTYYTEDYYDYIQHKITPSISMFLGRNSTSNVSLYYDITFLKYLGRKAQNIDGDYGSNKIGQHTSAFGVFFKRPIYKNLSLNVKMNYLMSSSNMKYESVYRYNYDVVNYFAGFNWEM